MSDIFNRTVVTFDKDIAYGDTSDHDAWQILKGGGPLNIFSVSIVGGKIVIHYSNIGAPPTEVTFTGPPPPFRDVEGAMLESFASPIPYP